MARKIEELDIPKSEKGRIFPPTDGRFDPVLDAIALAVGNIEEDGRWIRIFSLEEANDIEYRSVAAVQELKKRLNFFKTEEETYYEAMLNLDKFLQEFKNDARQNTWQNREVISAETTMYGFILKKSDIGGINRHRTPRDKVPQSILTVADVATNLVLWEHLGGIHGFGDTPNPYETMMELFNLGVAEFDFKPIDEVERFVGKVKTHPQNDKGFQFSI